MFELAELVLVAQFQRLVVCELVLELIVLVVVGPLQLIYLVLKQQYLGRIVFL